MADETIAVEALRRILAAEVRVLKQGDFAALAGLVAEKERLVARLAAAPCDARGLERLRAEAEATGRLLGAAARGISAARSRIEDIRRVAQRLDTYDRAGRARSVDLGPASVERRA